MFFRKIMILIQLLSLLVQEYDSKRIAICLTEVAEPAVWTETDAGAVTRSGIAAAPR